MAVAPASRPMKPPRTRNYLWGDHFYDDSVWFRNNVHRPDWFNEDTDSGGVPRQVQTLSKDLAPGTLVSPVRYPNRKVRLTVRKAGHRIPGWWCEEQDVPGVRSGGLADSVLDEGWVVVEEPEITTPGPGTTSGVEGPETGENPKDRIGQTKPQLHLNPPAALVYMSQVMALGAEKYGAYNWREKKVRRTVYISAALRHLTQALDGEDADSETGVPHEASVMACMAIILDALATGNLVDDRPTPGAAGRLIDEFTKTKGAGA